MTTEETPLVVNDIRKKYGARTALDGISFAVNRGLCVGLLGPNGAGKTTTIKICLGASIADCGQVSIFGLAIPEKSLLARKRVGVVPQMNVLDPDFNCAENLSVYASYFGIEQKTAQQRIPRLLEFAGLTTRSEEKIANLSGGMQRRLSLARALINDPSLIFLDEPTTGLDPQARHLIWERARRLLNDGKTILLTTHFLEEAERLCDIVHIMDSGRIIESGVPHDLVRHHVENEVVELQDKNAAAWLESNKTLSERSEHFGELIYCYCTDATLLVSALHQTNFRFIRRQANLEDVFLRLTGRELRE